MSTTQTLEHFQLVDDVVAFIKQRLPQNVDPQNWKTVCEDVLNCHLAEVEPMLLKEFEKIQGDRLAENRIRGLMRAVSWHTHPQLPREELLKKLEVFRDRLPATDRANLAAVQCALEEQRDGFDAYDAALALEALKTCPIDPNDETTFKELRDQIYYQLLYPHWFEVIRQWTEQQSKATV